MRTAAFSFEAQMKDIPFVIKNPTLGIINSDILADASAPGLLATGLIKEVSVHDQLKEVSVHDQINVSVMHHFQIHLITQRTNRTVMPPSKPWNRLT